VDVLIQSIFPLWSNTYLIKSCNCFYKSPWHLLIINALLFSPVHYRVFVCPTVTIAKLGMLVDLSLSWQGHGDSTILITDWSSGPSMEGYSKLVGFIHWLWRHCFERFYINDYTKTRIDTSTNSMVIHNAIKFVQQEAE
jgi:hypothetical protein